MRVQESRGAGEKEMKAEIVRDMPTEKVKKGRYKKTFKKNTSF